MSADPRAELLAIEDWRNRIRTNITLASAQRIRSLFSEINPNLVGEELFESRWTDRRKEAAVLIPIVDRPGGATILLTVRSSQMPSHAGQISFPGGRVQSDDADRIATALREANEEVSISPQSVEVIGSLGVHEGGIGFSVTPVVGIVPSDVQLAACPREVSEIFEVPLSFFADLDNHTTEQRVHEGIAYNMYAVPYGGFHIWGLTAGILRTFAETLQK